MRREFMIAMLALSASGCRIDDRIQRKSIADLYREAVDAAARRPETIQPCFPSEAHSHPPTGETMLSEVHAERHEFASHASTNVQPAVFREESIASLPVLPASSQVVKPNGEPIVGVVLESHPSIEKSVISEVFEQTEIREAIQILATTAGVEVIIDETVGGITSAQIENESFESALKKVLMPVGLVYAKVDGKYVIAPPEPDSPLFSYVSQRSQYSPLYHRITPLIALLPLRFKPFLHPSEERNIVIIDAPQEIRIEIVKRLHELDQPVPQVELEAIVCVVSPDCGFRFGLDWGHVVGVGGTDSLKMGMNGLTFSGAASPNGIDQTFADFAVTSAMLKLLVKEGYITIRAAPRVTTKDGEKASISLNREAFFSLQPSSSSVLFRQDVQKVEAGISLEITPRVHGDMVAVQIDKAEVSEDIRSSDTSSDNSSSSFPIINRRVVKTSVNVRDGHTIVIGGLVQSQSIERITRMPIMSRIPIIGNIFKTVDKQKQDAEVAVFISPRIVPAEAHGVP
jgi:type II secretory pathway component GspD/PulD (secretin)